MNQTTIYTRTLTVLSFVAGCLLSPFAFAVTISLVLLEYAVSQKNDEIARIYGIIDSSCAKREDLVDLEVRVDKRFKEPSGKDELAALSDRLDTLEKSITRKPVINSPEKVPLYDPLGRTR